MSVVIDLRCSYCDYPASTKCGRCEVVHYCCAACQKAEWPDHKKICRILKNHPPPAGFIPSFNPNTFFNYTKFSSTNRPIYPSPWHLSRVEDGLIPTTTYHEITSSPVGGLYAAVEMFKRAEAIHGEEKAKEADRMFAMSGHKSMEKVKQQEVFQNDEEMYMRVLDAYRVDCYEKSRKYAGNEQLTKVYKPSKTGFRDYFLYPLLLSQFGPSPPSSSSSTSTSSPVRQAANYLSNTLKTIKDSFPSASIDRPVTEEEYESALAFGVARHLRGLVLSVAKGRLMEEGLWWIMEAEEGM